MSTNKAILSYTQPYGEVHVSNDLSKMAMLFIELMCSQAEANKNYGELIRTNEVLAQFGFVNTKDAKLLGEMSGQMAAYKKATDTLTFMESVWQNFGKDTILVRYDHFFEILEKYDMVCGAFDRYLGSVPQSALDTLTRLNLMWERKELGEDFALGMNYTDVLLFRDEVTGVDEMKRQLRMPLRTDNKDVKAAINDYIGFNRGSLSDDGIRNNLTDVLFIAAPAADMKPIKMRVEIMTKNIVRLREAAELAYFNPDWEYVKNARQAYEDEENRLIEVINASDINRYAKISFIHHEPIFMRILQDPFICSLTPYGVLIHTKWGAEAEDATIKRYEQLRNTIIG